MEALDLNVMTPYWKVKLQWTEHFRDNDNYPDSKRGKSLFCESETSLDEALVEALTICIKAELKENKDRHNYESESVEITGVYEWRDDWSMRLPDEVYEIHPLNLRMYAIRFYHRHIGKRIGENLVLWNKRLRSDKYFLEYCEEQDKLKQAEKQKRAQKRADIIAADLLLKDYEERQEYKRLKAKYE